MVAYWEVAARPAYDMFSKYKYLIVNLVFPTSVFGGGTFCLPLFLIIAYLYLFVHSEFAYFVSRRKGMPYELLVETFEIHNLASG